MTVEVPSAGWLALGVVATGAPDLGVGWVQAFHCDGRPLAWVDRASSRPIVVVEHAGTVVLAVGTALGVVPASRRYRLDTRFVAQNTRDGDGGDDGDAGDSGDGDGTEGSDNEILPASWPDPRDVGTRDGDSGDGDSGDGDSGDGDGTEGSDNEILPVSWPDPRGVGTRDGDSGDGDSGDGDSGDGDGTEGSDNEILPIQRPGRGVEGVLPASSFGQVVEHPFFVARPRSLVLEMEVDRDVRVELIHESGARLASIKVAAGTPMAQTISLPVGRFSVRVLGPEAQSVRYRLRLR